MNNSKLWAKKNDKSGEFRWLPLEQHLLDTRGVILYLWRNWLSIGQRQVIINSMSIKDEVEAERLIGFIGYSHDIGKATPAFQSKKSFTNSEDLDKRLIEELEIQGFTDLSLFSKSDVKHSPHAIAGQWLLNKFGISEDIASIIGGHHGVPIVSKNIIKDQDVYLNNYYQSDIHNAPIKERWATVQLAIFEKALKLNGYESVEQIPSIKQPGLVILSGLLIMADWIASNEQYFPLFSIYEDDIDESNDRLSYGINNWAQTTLWQPSLMLNAESSYQNRFNFNPRNMQKVMFDTINKCQNPGIFILEAPMGGGKTEAALIGAEQLAAKLNRSGLFFGLPTQATSNGIFPRINSWLKKVTDETLDTLGIRLVHGKASLNEQFSKLSHSSGINIDENPFEGSVIINQWFSGRKTTVLDDFVVGTVDQFLLTALKQKHLALRHLGFSKKVVVIDEVHAYDAYMNQYLMQAIKWMGAYNVPVIILSATLPEKRRYELVKSYIIGKGIKNRDIIMNIDEKKNDYYPLITYSNGKEIKEITDFEKNESKSVEVIKKESESITEIIDEEYKKPGIIGVIVNTVKTSQKIAEYCIQQYGEDNVMLLHSNMIAVDRVEREKELLNLIGSGSQRPSKKIIIGTQVIEQSLDIDFDILITELAPMDLTLQRIGRLHRRDSTKRPIERKEVIVYITGTSETLEFDEGTLFIYGGYLLARTQYFLPDKLTLPSDISTLVQKVYNEEKIILPENLETIYEAFKEKHKDKIDLKEAKAKTFRLADPVYKSTKFKSGNMVGWLKNQSIVDSEEHGYAQVRDIEDTIEIIALKKVGDNGYGYFGKNEDVSSRVDSASVAKEIAKHTLRLPLALSSKYNIKNTIKELEKYNIDKLENWQQTTWLKGSLGIIFDENNEFTLNDFTFRYSEKYGLIYKRSDLIESI